MFRQLQDEHDVDDDVSRTSQSSDRDRHQEVDTSPTVKAFELAVRGLCMLGRLLLAVAKAVLQLWKSKSSATADDHTRLPSPVLLPTCSHIAN